MMNEAGVSPKSEVRAGIERYLTFGQEPCAELCDESQQSCTT